MTKTHGTLLLLLAAPVAVRAQEPVQPAPDSAVVPCVGCATGKHFPMAVGEFFFSELTPYSIDRWVKNAPWARTSLRSWAENLKHGWVWDNDHFVANQFAHPYSGALYFNSARSNGYGFWASAPFSLVGSAVWEYFGETNRPSINDLANTTLGGISLGEVTYRLSCIILDNRSTGAERVFREIGAALVDPVRALSRLVRRDVGRVGPNPIDRLPSKVQASLGWLKARPNSGPGRIRRSPTSR